MSSSESRCEALKMNADIYARFEPGDRVMKGMTDLRILYEAGRYSEIVKMAVLFPPTKEEIVEVIEAHERLLDQLGRNDLTETKNRHTKNLEELMDAINGSCSQVLKDGVWEHDRKTQEFLLVWAQKSDKKEKYWAELILKDFQENEDLKYSDGWLANTDGIKTCMELFGLPQETIRTRAETVILHELSGVKFDTLVVLAGNAKKLIDLLGVPSENIEKRIRGLMIEENIKKSPLNCLKAAKKMEFSIEPWKEFFYEGAKALILAANDETCFPTRWNKINDACEIFAALKSDLGDSRGDAFTELWTEENKHEENAPRDFLWQASKTLEFEYNPVGLKDIIETLWRGIKR